MKATAFEFRFRYLIHVLLYVLGGLAPWDRLFGNSSSLSTWLLLAGYVARNRWMSFSASTIALLVLGIVCALVAAALRTWASAWLSPAVVQDAHMQGAALIADGPYRRLRNPLYLGTLIHTFALALLMPPSGAIFVLLAIGLFQLRLIAAEQAFLTARLGEPYVAYCRLVPSLLPALTPRTAPSGRQPTWGPAFLSEIYFWGVAVSFLLVGYRYNAFLVSQGVIIAAGLSLVARAFVTPRPTQP